MRLKKGGRGPWVAAILLFAVTLIGLGNPDFWRWSERVQTQPTPGGEGLSLLESFRFSDAADLARWEQKVFKGTTRYDLVEEGGATFLRVTSEDASSGLFLKMRHLATPNIYLRWKWRANEFPPKKEPLRFCNRAEDDFAARVYVIFQAANLFKSDVIEYVWDEHLPEGTSGDSAYSDRIKLLVIRSGAAKNGNAGWHEERRNPYEDYLRLFGKPPKHPIGILALMSDSDNTGTRAVADFEEIVLESKT